MAVSRFSDRGLAAVGSRVDYSEEVRGLIVGDFGEAVKSDAKRSLSTYPLETLIALK